jgi:hypothetical protein
MATKGQRWKVRGYLHFHHYAALFAAPITAAEFAARSGAALDTSRQALARWHAEGLLYNAGKIRKARGAPATRYCADPRAALIARVAWLFGAGG